MNKEGTEGTEGRVALVVTTLHKGVFFGYGIPTDTSTITLEQAQMCVYWPSQNHGVVGLAAQGPHANSRVGPPAPKIILRDVTAVMFASPEAEVKWKTQPWKE